MRSPVRYRIKRAEDGSADYHYVVLGGNGATFASTQRFDTPSAAESRVEGLWLAHVKAVLRCLGGDQVSDDRATLLSNFPVPYTRDSIRATHKGGRG